MRRVTSALAAVLLSTVALLVPALSAVAAEPDTIYALLNSARAANGQNALVRNPALDEVAAAWAVQLSAAGVLSHNPNYPEQIPAGWSRAGENVARGQQTADEMHWAWMDSPGHRANILGDYTDVGIAWLSANGETWGVQVFANYAPGAIRAAALAAAISAGDENLQLSTLSLPGPAGGPVAEPVAEYDGKVLTTARRPLGAVAPATPPGWIPFAMMAGAVLLVGAAGVRTARARRYLPER